ncbi:MAG: DUF2892 domain-containing protein [Dactylosporangium sp.]|nr:DUF2892 domain-containing protein [Dactylosporangium sp.]
MNRPVGRIARVVVGIALIVAGLAAGGVGGTVLVVVGLVPVATGVAGICLLGPLLGGSLR